MTRWLETDTFTNKDISTAVLIGSYTADADRMIACQFFADQVAGNGDYGIYLTLQINGAGSAYRIIPITEAAAASGLTAIAGQSILVAVRSGDVLALYLDGLAGDNSTPDTIVRWFELAALRPTTADRTLDVSAGGEAGIDFDNVKAATAPTTLTNITVPTVTTLTNMPAAAPSAADNATAAAAAILVTPANKLATGGTGQAFADVQSWRGTAPNNLTSGKVQAYVDLFGANSIAAYAIAADAVTKIQAGLATPTNITAGTITTATNLTNLPAAAALEATLTAIKGATFSGATDSLEAISEAVAGVSAGSGLTAQQTRDAMKLAPTAGAPAAGSVDAHLDDILAYGGGSGKGSYTDTITDGADPLDGVRVQLSTDPEGVNRVYEAFTNALGVFEMNPDPGTYYRWLDLAGYTFTQGVQVEVAEL